MAGTLILEIIAVLLALPVVGVVGGGLTRGSAAYLIGFVVLLVLLTGMQGRPWAIWANLLAQLVLVAGFLVYPAVGFMGVVFLIVWGVIAYLRAEVLRRQRQGRLPGQQVPPD
jgi:predicted membrane protein